MLFHVNNVFGGIASISHLTGWNEEYWGFNSEDASVGVYLVFENFIK